MDKDARKGGFYSTDDLAHNLWVNLLGDFRSSLDVEFSTSAEAAFLGGVKVFRDFAYFDDFDLPPAAFKRRKQLINLLKKYRFAADAYSDAELDQRTISNYFGEQKRLSTPRKRTHLGFLVLQEARKIVKGILGPFDEDAVINNCRFGKKSSIGCPFSLAYIDVKLSKASAFTGSSQCSKWFFERVLPDDKLLQEIVSKIEFDTVPGALEHDSLNLVLVPKTWKMHRLITPLTLLALYASNGIGAVITQKLKDYGLDIARLQSRHRFLVRRFSVTKTHATADLSAASDSITSELLSMLIPRDWLRSIKSVLTHKVVWKDDYGVHSAFTHSVLPMGNGMTFPLETLVFYSLIRALGNLTGVAGSIYSVYGDDLIYPSKLHPYVAHFFSEFGLILNHDKTFVDSPFRESCGADFYRGCDVRSFYLQGTAQNLTRTNYRAFLHKTINGLRRRWDDNEIPGTLAFLLNELQSVSESLLRVPPDYPDTAGIKVDSPSDFPISDIRFRWSPIYYEHYESVINGRRVLTDNGNFVFSAMEAATERRFVECIMPYYWLALQGLNDDPEEENFSGSRKPPSPHTTRSSSLQWTKVKRVRFYTRKDGTKVKKKIVKVSPTVAARLSERYITKRGSISVWA